MTATGAPPVDPGPRIAAFFGARPPRRLGVAVSGGGDSLALLVLLDGWRQAGGPGLRVVTVDHGLRPEAAHEAAVVARICAARGLDHDTLHWTPDRTVAGNMADRARRARYALMADWARAHALGHVALGHTADDQAETLLMRLAREAGVDGLAAMRPRWSSGGVTFCRPALALTRAALRDVLLARGLGWAEDPGNSDPAYARARARQVLAALGPLGIDAEGLARVARNLAAARQALRLHAAGAAQGLVRFAGGDVIMDRAGLLAQPPETVRRLLAAALCWVTGPGYAPRGVALDRMIADIGAGQCATLHGCLAHSEGAALHVGREPAAVAGLRAAPGQVWDGRWRLDGPPTPPGAYLAALGAEGLRACAHWRETGLPRSTLTAAPALWRDGHLLAAPLARAGQGWQVALLRDGQDYFDTVTSH